MTQFRLLLCVMSIFLYALNCVAEEKKFKDEMEISLSDKTGNTDTTDLDLKNLMAYQFNEKIDGLWILSLAYGQTDGDKTTENYATRVKGNYTCNERLYLSAIGGWKQDKFSGIDHRYYIGPALGYKFLLGPKHHLSAEIGTQYVNESYTDDTDNDYMEGRAFGFYQLKITDKSDFKQALEFLRDLETSQNYKINSITSVTAAINSWLYLKTSYVIQFNNQPVADDINKTDKILAATLGINF